MPGSHDNRLKPSVKPHARLSQRREIPSRALACVTNASRCVCLFSRGRRVPPSILFYEFLVGRERRCLLV